jgi:hypothetical protein
MKTSFEKFMASSAVQSVELSTIKVDLAMDINAIMKAADALIFENAKLESKAISLLNDVNKVYTSSWPDAKPLLSEFENALKQMQTLGVEPPKAFVNSYATYKKEIGNVAKMKAAVLGKLADIDSIQGSFDR